MVKKKKSSSKKRDVFGDVQALVIELFRAYPDKRLSVKIIASTLGAKNNDQKDLLRAVVRVLFENGTIEQVSEGKYRLARTNRTVLEGVADVTTSGTIYVVVEGQDSDILVEPRDAERVLHGDRVQVLITRRSRKAGQNPKGEITSIVERSAKNYVGTLQLTEKSAFVTPDNRRIGVDIFIPMREVGEAKDGDKVVIRIVEWSSSMKSPLGRMIDVLGAAGENNTEMHAILAEYDLPYSYPAKIEEAAKQIPETITEKEIAKRRDMRSVPTMTIDPADAKDFDDALSIERLENGNYEVGVHIADVTHYVCPGDVIDQEGQERATSIYLVDRTIPMLPERLSNGLCSLRPHEEKLSFSAIFEINEAGKVLGEWFGRTVIYSDRRFTYAEAQEVIETGEGDMQEQVLTLNALARKLRAERFRNGSISFERTEAKFELDEKGKPLNVFFKEMKESNQLVEEFMLLANKKVAEFIGRQRGGTKGKGNPRTFVYRIHDVPNPDKLSSLRSFATRFGHQMKADVKGKELAGEINKLMSSIHGKQEENIISTLAIRTMAKATYSTQNIGHYGLAFDFYTHFTSPIRRYPDMMVHRLLAHYLAGGASEDAAYYETLCEHSSAMEVRASEAERASIKYKMVEFMVDKVGEEFDGHISGCTEWGIYVELDDTKIEGMVALRDLDGDFYTFNDQEYAIVGERQGRRFTLGDGVRIRITRADLQRKQLDFEMIATYDFESGKAIPIESDRRRY